MVFVSLLAPQVPFQEVVFFQFYFSVNLVEDGQYMMSVCVDEGFSSQLSCTETI